MRTNSAITAPSSSPASSWRKWPAPASTGCSRPAAPGTARFSTGAIAPVIGSRSLNATRNGLSHAASRCQAARLASDAGLSGSAGTRFGIARTAAAYDGSGNGAS